MPNSITSLIGQSDARVKVRSSSSSNVSLTSYSNAFYPIKRIPAYINACGAFFHINNSNFSYNEQTKDPSCSYQFKRRFKIIGQAHSEMSLTQAVWCPKLGFNGSASGFLSLEGVSSSVIKKQATSEGQLALLGNTEANISKLRMDASVDLTLISESQAKVITSSEANSNKELLSSSSSSVTVPSMSFSQINLQGNAFDGLTLIGNAQGDLNLNGNVLSPKVIVNSNAQSSSFELSGEAEAAISRLGVSNVTGSSVLTGNSDGNLSKVTSTASFNALLEGNAFSSPSKIRISDNVNGFFTLSGNSDGNVPKVTSSASGSSLLTGNSDGNFKFSSGPAVGTANLSFTIIEEERVVTNSGILIDPYDWHAGFDFTDLGHETVSQNPNSEVNIFRPMSTSEPSVLANFDSDQLGNSYGGIQIIEKDRSTDSFLSSAIGNNRINEARKISSPISANTYFNFPSETMGLPNTRSIWFRLIGKINTNERFHFNLGGSGLNPITSGNQRANMHISVTADATSTYFNTKVYGGPNSFGVPVTISNNFLIIPVNTWGIYDVIMYYNSQTRYEAYLNGQQSGVINGPPNSGFTSRDSPYNTMFRSSLGVDDADLLFFGFRLDNNINFVQHQSDWLNSGL